MKWYTILLLLLITACNSKKDPEPDSQEDETSWTLFNPQVYDVIDSTDTRMQLDLKSNAIWYQDSKAGLIYLEVNGDFTITAVVKARKRSDNDQEVACEVCLGGLMARDPDPSGGENYVHIVTGNTPVGIGVETKRTENGNSTYEPTNDGVADNELKLQRTGTTYTLYKRSVGASDWILAATYQHTGLPETLQVGINIYTAHGGPDIADLSVIYENLVIVQ